MLLSEHFLIHILIDCIDKTWRSRIDIRAEIRQIILLHTYVVYKPELLSCAHLKSLEVGRANKQAVCAYKLSLVGNAETLPFVLCSFDGFGLLDRIPKNCICLFNAWCFVHTYILSLVGRSVDEEMIGERTESGPYSCTMINCSYRNNRLHDHWSVFSDAKQSLFNSLFFFKFYLFKYFLFVLRWRF